LGISGVYRVGEDRENGPTPLQQLLGGGAARCAEPITGR